MELISYIMEDALILIPVLMILGKMIKVSSIMPNRFIPFALLSISIVFSTIMMGLSLETFIQAILVTGAAVFGHQLVKQMREIN
ncbi:phage holin family protein [Alkalibacillus haloalkaliphilus]|uniref:phage holin family protein n=1 Tax=Alkalibacillus haloalkaliphilus TaxID=94136 RepID=UPI002936BB35|nr:phage holin family protein [Alkalibacillus haloalkaliphilus]MDV2582759.1 phage holin family protein [Alkalibacillus haloalkaliphilus]